MPPSICPPIYKVDDGAARSVVAARCARLAVGDRVTAVRWPVSRVLYRFPGDGYSSSAAVAGRVEQPTRTAAQDRACRARRHVSLHGLAPDGVYHARPVAGPAVRSYRTFSPLPIEIGGLFSVALSLGSPPPGVTRHPDPVEPGLSSPRAARAWAAAIRPSDSGRIIGAGAGPVKTQRPANPHEVI